MNHYHCFFQVYIGAHVHYHHVIMECYPTDLVNLEENDYMYLLRSSKAVYLTQEDLKNEYVRGLVMDGESLLKRIKKQINYNSPKNESLPI